MLGACSVSKRPVEDGPVLLVRSVMPTPEVTGAAPTAKRLSGERQREERLRQARAGQLMWQSMTPAGRKAFAENLEELTSRLETKANPLSIDLDQGSPQDLLKKLLGQYLPTLTAARHLAEGTWRHRGWQLSLAARCPRSQDKPNTRCIRLTQQGGARDERQFRFSAWSAGQALFLTRTASQPAAGIDAVRSAIGKVGSNVALVLSADDLLVKHDPLRRRMAASAKRLARLLKRKHLKSFDFLAALADELPTGSKLSSASLARDQVMVIPRMGSLARLSAFRTEVRGRNAT